ncbi:MAG TPA: iron ABC transporter permease [Thermoanaerobaculia bacterium]|nr:iron ABC transporter permease [Thermoanaerobaculia bacterium]
MSSPARRARLMLAALALLAAAVALGFAVGGVPLSLRELISGDGEAGRTARLIASLRLPRVLLASLVGGCLALAGAALQALLKNPLADPFLLGTSGGAAVGAAAAALAGASPLVSPAAAFVGAAGASVGIAALARRGGRLDLQRLLLAGLIANAFFSALLLGAFSVASGEAARSMLFWMMGSLSDATPMRVLALCPYAAVGLVVLAASASRLNLFVVGEENAAALGVDTERTKRIVFLSASLLTGAAVAFAGVIGFVGLLVPHAVRAVTGNDQRTLLPVSAVAGAALLVAADAVARSVVAPVELPIGAITAAIGAPLFAWLLLRTP